MKLKTLSVLSAPFLSKVLLLFKHTKHSTTMKIRWCLVVIVVVGVGFE